MLLIAIIGFFAKKYLNHIETTIKELQINFQKQLGYTRNVLREHSDTITKFKNEFADSYIGLKDSLSNFRQEIKNDVHDLKSEFIDIEKKGEILTARMEIATDKHNRNAEYSRELFSVIKEHEARLNELFTLLSSRSMSLKKTEIVLQSRKNEND